MTSEKQHSLDKVYETLLQIVLYDFPIEQIHNYVIPEIMGYGTTLDEKILGFPGFLKIINDQREQSVGMKVSFQIAPIHRRLCSGEDAAVYVDEIRVMMEFGDGNTSDFILRVSWVFEYINSQWMLTHWHGSKAVEITGDTWHKEEWKQKNEALQKIVDEKTKELQQSLIELKSTQSQLIQSEKMASLGELTAGIAHEIQNPLNFVNNFSEVNTELIRDLKSEIKKGNIEEVIALSDNIESNEAKINLHGKRAGDIVKSMLQHSRKSTSQKELTDINALCDEYLRLAYHGLRAKDKTFNAEFKTDFDLTIPKLTVIPQDIGRVILNLINNAFYAVNEKVKFLASSGQPRISNFQPQVTVATRNLGAKIQITIQDNGIGIPENIKAKIFQPFFTTKPTGSGTGLGLSISYDIIKAHGGDLSVNSTEGEGSSFIITL